MNKTSKYRGVNWNKREQKWISVFTHNGKTESTRFESEREAAKLYDLRRIRAGLSPVNVLKKC